LKIIPRVSFVHDPEIDRGGASKRHTVKIEAVLTDGSRLSTSIEQRRGSSHYPLSDEEVFEKFHRLARASLDGQKTDQAIDAVASIEREPNLKRLTGLLAGRPDGATQTA
jgi:2-methylcitrate dehydratase PrpD